MVRVRYTKRVSVNKMQMNFDNPSFSFPNHYASAVLRLYNKQKQVRFLFTFALVL